MTLRLALLLSLVLGASRAEAQGTNAEPTPALGLGGDEPALEASEALLAALAGSSAQLVHDESGKVRALFGARIRGMGEPAARARALLRRFAVVFGLPSDATFEVTSERDAHGLHIVRLVRVVGGLTIISGDAVVRFLPDGAIDFVQVARVPDSLASGDRRLRTADEAFSAARSLVGQDFDVLGVAPHLLPVFDELVPVWTADVATVSEASLETLFLDARSGVPLLRLPRVLDAMGTVFPRNPTSDMNVTTDVELTDLTGARLTGRYVRVASCNAGSGTGCAETAYATPDAMGDFLSAPVAGTYDDAFAEVNAYYHVNLAAAYFRNEHAFTWRCGASTTMEVLVNYTEAPFTPYDNAAYSPGGGSGGCGFLLFGQGRSGDFAWDADVVYHEYGHAVTDELTDILGFAANTLGVHYFPLAINEGASDYWAATLQGDGNIAESFSSVSGIGGHGSLRVIDNMLRCPSDLVGEGHFDGRHFAAMIWDVRQAVGAESADRVAFATLATFLSDVSLSDAAMGYRATAMSLADMGMIDAGTVAALDESVATRGLADCDRVVPLDDGSVRQGYSGSEQVTGSLGRSIAPLHYRIEIPADATSLTLRVARQTLAGSYSLHLRAGVAVRVASRIISSFEAPMGPSGELVIDEGTEFPLPRCQPLFIAVQVDDLTRAGQSLFTMQGLLTRSGDPGATCPELPDAGGPVGSDAGVGAEPAPMTGGCSCRVVGAERTPARTGWATLITVLAVLVARRSRR